MLVLHEPPEQIAVAASQIQYAHCAGGAKHRQYGIEPMLVEAQFLLDLLFLTGFSLLGLLGVLRVCLDKARQRLIRQVLAVLEVSAHDLLLLRM